MPQLQLQLPIFREGVHPITANLGYQREGDEIVYLHGMMPVFLHRCDDLASFKMIVSLFHINGNARQSELVRAFAVQPLALKRWVRKYREGYSPGFFKRMAARRIACQTYHKHPGGDWPENEFRNHQVPS